MKQDIGRCIVRLGTVWVELHSLLNTLEEKDVPKEIQEKVTKAMRLIDEASDELEPFQ